MMNNQIVGIEHKSFKGSDGTDVSGTKVYINGPFPRKSMGQGMMAESFFLSDAKARALDFKLDVGQEIKVYYNRYGKVDTLQLLDEPVEVE